MVSPSSSSDSPNRLPRWLIGSIIGICVLPILLTIVGVDFGLVSSQKLDESLRNVSSDKLSDTIYYVLGGSFLHTILEWSAFCTAIFTVILSFTYFHIKRDITTPILGVALFCAGMMDAFHTLAADRLISAIADNTNLIPFTWAICRLFNALIMLIGVSLLLIAKPQQFKHGSPFILGTSLLFSAIAYGIIHFCATSRVLPETMYPDALVTRPWDVIPLLLFLGAGLLVYPQFDQRYPSLFSHALIVSTIPNVVTQLHMAFGSKQLFDSDFNIAHFLKIIAYLVPLTGLILDYNYTYRRVDRINQELKDTLQQQQATAQELQASEANLKQLNEHLEGIVEQRTQKLEQATAQAQAASRAKSQFLANMSHELRTPLNGIMGYAQVLQYMQGLPQKARDRLNIIYQCGSYLLALIDDILDISKVEAGKMELNPSVFHLPAFLENVVELCRVRAELKNVTCQMTCDPELSVGVRADEKRLQQVLLNLIGNAVKFTDSGTVTLNVTRGSADIVRFEVRDTGIGMTPEELKRIFQPFEQAGSRQQQAEGTGLGLAICHSIVQLMGGQIEVASEVGAGSTFWFEVPLPPVDDWSQSLQTDRVGQIVGIRDRQPCVLVVDDKWENRSVLVHLLSPIGFEVREAADGHAGLRLAIAQQPDVIIADISMPGMDGLEMIRRIRQSEALAQTPILVSSASVFESDRYQSLEAGANDFFSKPINASELLQKLQHHLNLVWIYAETASDLNDASSQPQRQTDVILPPSEAIDELYTLTMKGNMKGIIRYLEDLVITQPHLTPFAAKVTQLAEAFDDEAILHCLDRA